MTPGLLRAARMGNCYSLLLSCLGKQSEVDVSYRGHDPHLLVGYTASCPRCGGREGSERHWPMLVLPAFLRRSLLASLLFTQRVLTWGAEKEKDRGARKGQGR